MTSNMLQRTMTTQQAAEYLGFSTVSLKRWRSKGTGPTFIRLGTRRVRYRQEDLDAWVDSGSSTAQI